MHVHVNDVVRCFSLSLKIAGQAAVEVHGGGDDAGAVHPKGRGVAAGPQDRLGRSDRGRGPPPQEQPLQAQRESGWSAG